MDSADVLILGNKIQVEQLNGMKQDFIGLWNIHND